ncbi:MAG: hypothetical protein WDO14_02310 [Bacteroidota bacterium]
MLEKTTDDGAWNLKEFPKEGKAFYKPYLDHFQAVGEGSRNSRFLPTPGQIASKLYKILETKAPGFKYNLAIDAKIVDNILTKFIPFSWRAAMNKRMFRLSKIKSLNAHIA